MKRVLLNSLSGGVRFLATAVAAFVLAPIVVHSLGNEAYGAWEILLSVQAYVLLLDLGVNPAVVRFVARSDAQGDQEKLRAVFNSALLFAVLVGLVAMGILWLIGLFPEQTLNLRVGSVPGLQLSFVIMGIQLLISFSGAIFVAVLMGLQKHYLVNAVQTAGIVLQTAAIILALTRADGAGLVWMAGIFTASVLLQNVTMAGVLVTCRRDLRVKLSLSWPVMRELYVFGLKSMILMAAQRLQKEVMPVLIGWILGVGQVVFFTLASRLTDYAYSLSMSLGFPLTARFSELHGRGRLAATREAWFAYTRFLQFAVFGLGVGILALGEWFLRIWIGPEYADAGGQVVRILAVAFLIEGLLPNAGRLLVAFNKHGRAAIWLLCIAILGVPVAGVLASKYGVSGIAVSLLITRFLGVAVVWFFASRAVRISLGSHMRHTAARFVLPVGLQASTLVALMTVWSPDSYGRLFGIAGASLLPYCLAAWFVVLRRDDRRALLKSFRSRLRRLDLTSRE